MEVEAEQREQKTHVLCMYVCVCVRMCVCVVCVYVCVLLCVCVCVVNVSESRRGGVRTAGPLNFSCGPRLL